jgi:hypothetical protein
MQSALDERNARSGRCLPRTWIVPRLTRCDETYGDIEGFCDRWLLTLGACAIDALEVERASDRIAPLPVPAITSERRAWAIRRVDAGPIGLGPAVGWSLVPALAGGDGSVFELHAPI